jgi:hypothetical protein
MLLLYVFIVLLILLTLLSAFGGSIRASPAPAVRFERFTDEEREELEEFIGSEPFQRGLYAPSPAPMEPQIFRPMSTSSPTMSMPTMTSSSMPMMSSPSMSMPTMSSPSMSMPMMSTTAPASMMGSSSMEMYEEIERDGGAIEPFEQNDLLQASY